MTPGLGGIAYPGSVGNAKRQPAHDLAVALDEAEAAIGQFQFGFAIAARAGRDADDLAPVRGEILRLRTLHLDANERLRHVLSDEILPVRARRRVWSEHIVAAVGVVELDEGGAAIARMQLHAMIGRVR